jgi:hypothetical protein
MCIDYHALFGVQRLTSSRLFALAMDCDDDVDHDIATPDSGQPCSLTAKAHHSRLGWREVLKTVAVSHSS